jgi:hypothetical protein
MRPLMLAFLILSPFIAVAQNYHIHALTPGPAARLAHVVASTAQMKMASVVHAVQALLT